jgi:hypothetical protein
MSQTGPNLQCISIGGMKSKAEGDWSPNSGRAEYEKEASFSIIINSE